jgi:hypothetical protein
MGQQMIKTTYWVRLEKIGRSIPAISIYFPKGVTRNPRDFHPSIDEITRTHNLFHF